MTGPGDFPGGPAVKTPHSLEESGSLTSDYTTKLQ